MNIFKFDKITAFLRHYVDHLPKKGRGEVTRLATGLGVSRTLISQVMSGEKNLTPEQGQRLCRYLGLDERESDYLSFLIQRDRAGTKDLEKFWQNKLEKIREEFLKVINRVSIDRVLSEAERAVFYSSPLFSAIRLFTSVSEKGKSLEEITERFDLARPKAAHMLQFLVQAGLCKVSNGLYQMGLQKTHLEEGSPHLLRHHANWRMRAIQKSENLTSEELMYTVAVSLSKKDFKNLREEMVIFVKNFLTQVHASPAEEIACFNMDFFWIEK